jgi:hypothetical protein
VHRFLEHPDCPLVPGRWLDPNAGEGSLIRGARSFRGIRQDMITWDAVEIRDEAQAQLASCLDVGSARIRGDFLKTRASDYVGGTMWSAVLTNPAFNVAEETLRHARALAPRATIAFLMRVNFLAGHERSEFMRNHVPDVFVLPNRPGFQAKGTDSCEYAWMVFPPLPVIRTVGALHILKTTPLEIRKRDKARALALIGAAA